MYTIIICNNLTYRNMTLVPNRSKLGSLRLCLTERRALVYDVDDTNR